MSIRIEEVFQIEAHADRVWAYLTDPRQVVHCLPGAELTSVQDESTFLGRVKVKVGPITAAYAGKVILTERDEANRVVRMTGEGRESGGSGSAKMMMTSTVIVVLSSLPAYTDESSRSARSVASDAGFVTGVKVLANFSPFSRMVNWPGAASPSTSCGEDCSRPLRRTSRLSIL